MATGNFSVSRKIWSHPEFRPAVFSEREAFLWLISEASWKDRTVRAGRVVVDLKRGQLCASLRFMADAWQWPKSKVDRFLKRLKKRDMVGTVGGTGQLVITICNYDEYQPRPQNIGTDVGRKAGHDRDTSGTNYNKGEIKEEGKDRDTNVSLALSAPEPASTLADAVSEYNATADQVGWPKVQKMTPARSKALKARLRDCGGIEGWRVAMDKGKASDFLCGRTSKPWTGCSFDWITKQANFTKLMEGNYDNRDNNGSGPSRSGNGMVDAFAAVAARRSSGHQGSGGDGSGSF